MDDLDKTKARAADLLNDASDRFSADLSALRDDVTRLTTSVSDLVKSQAAGATSTVMGMMGDARERVNDSASDARERVTAATADLEAVIERNPLIAIVAALIAGLFMGILSRPRR
jgi:ElaB/YqjD/DUF883 family membrane-anchored ribosome-binding protein